jgi:hypothetical protein
MVAHRENRSKRSTPFHWYPADVPIYIVEEDVLALIATAHHVLEGAGKLHSYPPGHRPSFGPATPQVNRQSRSFLRRPRRRRPRRTA